MKKVFVALILLSGIMASGFYGQPAQADLIFNGSFEDTTNFVPDGNGTMSLPPGSFVMPGWQVVAAEIAWIGPTNPFAGPLAASNGSFFLDLTGYHDSSPYGGVQQTVSTVPGKSYVLGFDLGSSTVEGVPAAITAGIFPMGGTATTQTFTSTNTTSPAALWEHETMSFTASSGTAVISLTGAQGSHFIGLDNVTLNETPIPLPPTVWLLGSGLLGLMGWRRFRKD